MRVNTPESRLHKIWAAMIHRCTCPDDASFHNYGGRGIRVCERWMEFNHFMADMGFPSGGMTLERTDNDGGYSPSNCVWASRTAQARNQRSNRLITHDGETMCMAAWAERLGLSDSFIRRRMAVQGMTFAEAISKPKRYLVWRKSRLTTARMERQRGLR